ncbi:crotonase/enoyl-CoA hydratase family protein [Altererythrobacter sp. FM1]|uniref:crotonase/enoyl-CoA hydratase family protein n=1 Tax=Tsuneonella flava TaxID=2055955 RepID=UPI000C8100D5|nr:crotonase/enoyl-CoA hydratase family protein [Tsuneonella flava]ROT93734.1 crotonase/enoyl-CoA hydratase family protein [Altererythrobacter sp. FM1]UBS33152.1 crotonase/enoyl-CoA hydratase family protein [Altererythrobacter sp. N1]
MGDFVKMEKRGRIAILTFNHPDTMNAIATHEDCADLVSALHDIGDDTGISVAIVTGSGRAFSAGGNLQAMKDRNGIGPLASPADTRSNYRRGVQTISRAFNDCEVPLIAAVNGHAIGLGNDLACFCDMRIAADTAKFAAGFVKVGLIPGDGGAWALPRAVGYAKAAELMFTGDTLNAEEAKEIGLVSRVVPAERLMDEAMALAERVAANPPRSLRLAKRLLTDAQNMRLNEVLEMSASMQALAHETRDHKEAVDAFLEKRKPDFTGE